MQTDQDTTYCMVRERRRQRRHPALGFVTAFEGGRYDLYVVDDICPSGLRLRGPSRPIGSPMDLLIELDDLPPRWTRGWVVRSVADSKPGGGVVVELFERLDILIQRPA